MTKSVSPAFAPTTSSWASGGWGGCGWTPGVLALHGDGARGLGGSQGGEVLRVAHGGICGLSRRRTLSQAAVSPPCALHHASSHRSLRQVPAGAARGPWTSRTAPAPSYGVVSPRPSVTAAGNGCSVVLGQGTGPWHLPASVASPRHPSSSHWLPWGSHAGCGELQGGRE